MHRIIITGKNKDLGPGPAQGMEAYTPRERQMLKALKEAELLLRLTGDGLEIMVKNWWQIFAEPAIAKAEGR